MSNVSADINVELRHAGDFEIEVIAELDRDKDPRTICLFWTNPLTKRWRRISDSNPRLDAYLRKHFDDQISEAISFAAEDADDTEYDLSKDSF